MPHNAFRSVVLGLLAASAMGAQANAGQVWTTFDPPGSVETTAIAVNAHGLIVGGYSDSNAVRHGFLRTVDETITPFDEPDADPNTDTAALGVDTAGNLMGSFVKSGGTLGFVRKADGTFTSFRYKRLHTFPAAMNSRGVIVGFTFDDGGHVFLRKPNGVFMSLLSGMSAAPAAINKYNVVAGSVFAGSQVHGFVVSLTGGMTTFDPPGATSTQATSINAGGAITGTYTGSDNIGHGFLREPDGTFVTFDAPNAGTTSGSFGTIPKSIDADGNIAGCVYDNSSALHGFVRESSGAMHTVDAPDATMSTCIAAIGPGGKLIGQTDSHGFKALPRVWKQ